MNIERKLKQVAVRWAKGALKADGNTAYFPGVEISVRAENIKRLFVNSDGEDQISNTEVDMLGTQEMNLDDKLYIGTLESLTAGQQVDPNIVSNAFRVAAIDDVPSLRNEQTLRTVTL